MANAAVVDWQSKTNNSFLAIQPAANVEWTINNIEAEGAVELYRTDGSNEKLILPAGPVGTPTCITGLTLIATNSIYYRLKNVDGATRLIGYSGRVTT